MALCFDKNFLYYLFTWLILQCYLTYCFLHYYQLSLIVIWTFLSLFTILYSQAEDPSRLKFLISFSILANLCNFFLFILNSNSIFGLKNEDICSLVEKECQGRYNANHKYHVICDFKKLTSSFNDFIKPHLK